MTILPRSPPTQVVCMVVVLVVSGLVTRKEAPAGGVSLVELRAERPQILLEKLIGDDR